MTHIPPRFQIKPSDAIEIEPYPPCIGSIPFADNVEHAVSGIATTMINNQITKDKLELNQKLYNTGVNKTITDITSKAAKELFQLEQQYDIPEEERIIKIPPQTQLINQRIYQLKNKGQSAKDFLGLFITVNPPPNENDYRPFIDHVQKYTKKKLFSEYIYNFEITTKTSNRIHSHILVLRNLNNRAASENNIDRTTKQYFATLWDKPPLSTQLNIKKLYKGQNISPRINYIKGLKQSESKRLLCLADQLWRKENRLLDYYSNMKLHPEPCQEFNLSQDTASEHSGVASLEEEDSENSLRE